MNSTGLIKNFISGLGKTFRSQKSDSNQITKGTIMAKKKKIALYPGTFDPVTNGHLDILTRASLLFDEVIVGLAEHSPKKTLFSIEERLQLLNESIKNKRFGCPVKLIRFNGLLIQSARRHKATVLVRGLRAISDFEYELQMALMNRHLDSTIETVFLMPDEKFVYLSSSIVKEVARLRGNLSSFLPESVVQALRKKFNQ